jgi:rfaE bifunctional protein kinase chain/domain
MKKNLGGRIERLFTRFGRVTILVVGDLMLDRFVWGSVSRISPEAPVPVVEVTSQSDMPGGAANVVKNLCVLGTKACVCGVIGKDYIGRALTDKLTHNSIHLGGLIVDRRRATTLKTRIIAHSQQVVRVDTEDKAEVGGRLIARLLAYVKSIIGNIDAIIIEDYGKGMITQQLVSGLIALGTQHGKIIAVDPKKGRAMDYQGCTVITPNREEALWMAGAGSGEAYNINAVGSQLLTRWSCEGLLITLGEQGMILFQAGKRSLTIPTTAREVYDVSGAGDTVISSFTAALAAGADMKEAALVANYAAGVVVGKVGTGTASRREILEALHP